MEWIIPIIAILIGTAIVTLLLVPNRKRNEKPDEDKTPLCPGCSAGSCPAMRSDEVDIEAIREKLKERGSGANARAPMD